MPTTVLMPKFDMDQEAATVIEWLKNVGDPVKEDEALLVVETDKIAIEVPSPAGGFLVEICAAPGERVPVAQRIAVIASEKESALFSSPLARPEGEAPQDAAARKATPLAARMAKDLGINLREVPAEHERITQADIERFTRERQVEIASRVPEAATPAARRIAREAGLRLSEVPGSGPEGRVQAKDVAAFAKARMPKPDTAPSPDTLPAFSREFEAVPLTPRRRTISERMQASFQTAPHISLSVEVNVAQLESARMRLNAFAAQAGEEKISLTALLVKITAWALKRHPYLNSSLSGDTIRLWKEVNIGVAVAASEGLIVPVIHHANTLSLQQIASRFNDLAERARANRLSLEDVRDGTFTITNLGMYHIPQFRAVINPPEAAILAVGSIVRKPVIVGESDEVTIQPRMTLTLSADHRSVDGIIAARFLNDLVLAIETPEMLLYS